MADRTMPHAAVTVLAAIDQALIGAAAARGDQPVLDRTPAERADHESEIRYLRCRLDSAAGHLFETTARAARTAAELAWATADRARLADRLDIVEATCDRYRRQRDQARAALAIEEVLSARLAEVAKQYRCACGHAEHDVRRLRAQRAALIALVNEILARFVRHGNPGGACTSTGWVPDPVVAGWRRRLDTAASDQGPAGDV